MSAPSSLRWRLRDATAGAHARVDAQLGDAFGSVDGYAAFLRGMHRFVHSARRVLGDADGMADFEAALAADLAVLGGHPILGACETACGDANARLGWRYVVAGSSLGARVLLQRARALGFDASRGAGYLAMHAEGDAWRALLTTLDALTLTDDAERAACAGANAAFACVERCLDATRHETLPA